jgi:hypothetical protein
VHLALKLHGRDSLYPGNFSLIAKEKINIWDDGDADYSNHCTVCTKISFHAP